MKKSGFVAGLAGLVALAGGCSAPAEGPSPLTGLVDATEVDVASKIPGRVKELSVREGDAVEAGQQVATIESDEVQAKLDQVQAAISAAQARLRLAQAGARVEEKEASRQALAAARHQADVMKKSYDRVKSLLDQGAIPQAQFDEIESRWQVAMDQLAVAEARNAMVAKGARGEELDALRALVKQGEGSLAEVRSYEKETVQTSPLKGEVSKIVLHRGELAATGYPILTIVDLDDVWATFAVREDMLRGIDKGSRIEAEVPALGRKVSLEVFHVAAMGDFATWKATTDKGGFDLKSFEVKARPVEKVQGLRPGMTVRWMPR